MDPEIRTTRKIGQFRALIVGRPNAGKTTILRCIARSADGRVDPSSGRGLHNIDDELTFSSNPGFVFHDSCGIESGTTNEMENIQAFISARAKERSLDQKLHAIWYCIPTDNARLVTAAEEQFFDKIDPNGVPVILIFTKFESQEADAFHKLQGMCSLEGALLQTAQKAREAFDKDHLSRFKGRRYPPKEIVYLKNMDSENAECLEIIEQAMKALNNDTLKWLLATVQEVNLNLRTKQMLQSNDVQECLRGYIMDKSKAEILVKKIWTWFPHLLLHSPHVARYARVSYHYCCHDNCHYYDIARFSDKEIHLAISPLLSRKFLWSNPIPHAPNIKDQYLCALYFSASIAIVSEHSFWLSNKFPSNLKQAAQLYSKSSTAISVSQQIQAAFGDQISKIPSIMQGENPQYQEEIALPLSQIILDNLLAHGK